jgi:hypothetical protein
LRRPEAPDPWSDGGSVGGSPSAADWSTSVVPDAETSGTLAVAPPTGDGRYVRGGLLGAGAMGRVWLAQDTALGREVALKEPAALDGPASQRLLREASLCAQLEHPGIVPVHDVGWVDGRPFYTMRVVRGRSLADALGGADLEARLRLLRHVRAASEAVAWAHAHGVVHRDLKPSNIMIGGLGETQVVDWGLARRLEEPDEVGVASGDQSGVRLTRVGTVIGTPAYMSPEAARGEPVDPRGDVWGLGAVLYELLAGRPPFVQTDSEHVLSLVREAQVAPVQLEAPRAPRELAAVVDRAMRPDAAERYPSARELAEDLGRYLDGRRVEAHVYTPWELLGRLARAWRAPLLVAAVALAALGVMGVTGALRVAQERDRALVAEDEARAALLRSDQALAASLLRQAVDATVAGDRARAELLGARALRLGGSPEARGVLAAWSLQERPRLVREAALPDCDGVALASDGERVVCVRPDRVQVWQIGATAPDTTVFGHFLDATVDGRSLLLQRPYSSYEAGNIELRDLDAPHQRLALHPSTSGIKGATFTSGWLVGVGGEASGTRALRTADAVRDLLPYSALEAALGERAWVDLVVHGVEPGTWLMQTRAGGVVWRGAWGDRAARPPWIDAARQTPFVWALSVDGRQLGIGTAQGAVQLVDLQTYALLGQMELGLGLISSLEPDPRGTGWWFVHAERGLALVRPESDAVMGLPSAGVRAARMTTRGTVLAASDRLREWSVPTELSPVRFMHAHGVGAVSVAGDGERLAVAGGDGLGVVWSLRDGRALWRLPLEEAGQVTVKAVVVTSDGDHAVVANTEGAGPLVVRLADGAALRGPIPTNLYRRVVTGEGRALFAGYSRVDHPVLFEVPSLTPVPGTEMAFDPGDMAVSADGRWALVVDPRAGLMRAPMRGVFRFELLHAEPDLGHIDIAEDGHTVVVSGPAGRVRLIDTAAGRTLWSVDAGDIVLDVALSPGAERVAVARRDGRAEVRDAHTGALLLLLAGHEERVASVDWSPDGAWLATGSWDHAARRWDMRGIGADPAALEAEVEAAWGLTAEDLLVREAR